MDGVTEAQQIRMAELDARFGQPQQVVVVPVGSVVFVSPAWIEILEPVPTRRYAWDTGA